MATSDEILARQEAAITALETATDAITSAAADIKAAPRVAGEALETAEEAVETAEEAREIASGALPKAGGELTGRVTFAPMPTAIQTNFAESSASDDGYSTWHNAVEVRRNDKLYMHIAANTSYDADHAFLRLYNPEDNSKSNAVGIARDLGTGEFYGYAPPPRGLYNNDLPTAKWVMDYAPEKLTADRILHLGGTGASDTADLYDGRGLSADKPFATLPAIVAWIKSRYVGPYRAIITLHSDITTTGSINFSCPTLAAIKLTSDSTKRKINQGGMLSLGGGCMELENLILNPQAIDICLNCNGQSSPAVLRLTTGIEIIGSVTTAVVNAVTSGTVVIASAISGTVAGKRYQCVNGSRILTNSGNQEKIPGTEAGYCDTTSIYS